MLWFTNLQVLFADLRPAWWSSQTRRSWDCQWAISFVSFMYLMSHTPQSRRVIKRKRKRKPRRRPSKAWMIPKKVHLFHLRFLLSHVLAAANASSNEDKGLEPVPLKDEDPEGIKTISVSDPLEQAWKLLKPLLNSSRSLNATAWLSIYDVAIRRSKSVFT